MPQRVPIGRLKVIETTDRRCPVMTAAAEAAVSRVESRDGTEIAYWTAGEGPPLVLVHGLLGDHTRWAALQPHLQRHLTVHAMDRRGRGGSGDAPEYDPAREVEDVVAVVDAVAETSGTDVDVYGSSGGGMYALAAAARTSNIRRLVLFEPPAGAGPELMPPGLQEELDARLDAGDREGVLVAAYSRLVGLSEAEIDHLRAQPAWPNRLAAAHTVPREVRPAPRDVFDLARASDIEVPTLVLVASESPAVFHECATNVVAALPDARADVLDGQGHGAEMFAAELVADRVLTFLGATR
jgi:pimeloyl-ACP methyl ester carboxylesterase